MEERDNQQEFSFIKEKIKDKPINKRRMLLKLLWAVLCGIMFGLAACVAFVIVQPKLEALMDPKPQGDQVSIPRDEDPADDPANGDSANGQAQDPNTGQGGDGQGAVTEPQEPVYVERELEASDYQLLQDKLYAVGKKSSRAVVTVTGVTSDVDWFDSPYERETQASGIIIANTGKELLILTERKVITNAEAINITFINDDIVPATLKKYDGNTGIAIISVELAAVSEDTLNKVEIAVLGNSLTVKQGTVVLAIGSPLGANYSILSGSITSSGNTVSTWDGTYTIFTTDIIGSEQGSGVLVNLNGEVVGLVMQDYSSQGDQNTITAFSISELKGIIEDLSNGKDIPYLGLKVSTVTREISQEYGLPQGVYIKSVETDFQSPAMVAGLQEGDVIVSMNGQELLDMDDYTQTLLSLKPEQQIALHVMRLRGQEYVELEYAATVGILH